MKDIMVSITDGRRKFSRLIQGAINSLFSHTQFIIW
jgi:hypothetical protein